MTSVTGCHIHQVGLSRAVVFVMITLLLSTGCQRTPSSRQDRGFAGTWVLEASGRPFMVLVLSSEKDSFTGSITMPEWTTGNGIIFTNVRGPVTVRSAT